jgi:adenosylmethionine-8-amino-7-oxononanoate aminotransferase
MHAWQQEGVVPNIQVVGKGLGAGYIPISGVLIDHTVSRALESGSGKFSHGQNFQAHPVACLAVQQIIRYENLLSNVRSMGIRLAGILRTHLGHHHHVGHIRGRGLFWTIEFVEDRKLARPFPPDRNVGSSLCAAAMQAPYHLSIYLGEGTVDGVLGDHIC